MRRNNVNELSLIKKKSFLLWFIRGRIELILREMYSSTNLIQSRPKKVYTEINKLVDEDLKTYLTMLLNVGEDDTENIETLFDHYKDSYSEYMQEKG